jgi:hypothetical protein
LSGCSFSLFNIGGDTSLSASLEENNLVGRDMEEEPFPEQEGASVEGQSQDVRNEARKNAGSNPEDVSTGLCKELCLLSLPRST